MLVKEKADLLLKDEKDMCNGDSYKYIVSIFLKRMEILFINKKKSYFICGAIYNQI